MESFQLTPRITAGAQVVPLPHGWRLEIPTGERGHYRLAQLDDYSRLPRQHFPWQPPLRLSLRARASASDLPGTWGFGLWNDPFSLSLGVGGAARRFPALPQAAWFFYASAQNYLSFRDDLPAQGFLAAIFRSRAVPAPLLALASPALALLALPIAAQGMRRLLRRFIHQDAALIRVDMTEWHLYTLEWHSERVKLRVDDRTALETQVSPAAPLSLVLWIDNQFAALPPRGRLAFGFLANPAPAWVEIADLQVA